VGLSDQTLWLVLEAGPTGLTITPADMKLAVVYVFDSAGRLFDALAIEDPRFGTPYDTGIDLGADIYSMVAWLNPTDPYSLNLPYPAPATRSDMSDGVLSLDLPPDGVVDPSTLPMLMHGSVDDVTEPTTDATVEITLLSNVYDLNFTVGGVPLDGDRYMLQISDDNGMYDFENNYLDGADILYRAVATATPVEGNPDATGDLTFDMRTLRIDSGRNPQLTLVNLTTGQQIYPLDTGSANLVEMIGTTVPGADFGSDCSYDIVFDCSGSFGDDGTATLQPTVTVDGWQVKEDNYDIIQ
jgi:hypothetical protein